MNYQKDKRVVLTLDAGGTSFRFSAMEGGRPVTGTITLPSEGDHLRKCLGNIVAGFTEVKQRCPRPPAAISFAFPGPANYPLGIIGDLRNLTGFRGGVALGPMLEKQFGLPVFINNDAELFTFGEAIAGFLPYVNGLLKAAGSPMCYRNLCGITLGTGFGGGIVHNGELLSGDNSNAAQISLLRNKLDPEINSEEGASIRAVRRVYAGQAGIHLEDVPDPRGIEEIALGKAPGDRAAALEAYRRLGEVAGDALATTLALVDGLAVIGGGLSKGWRLLMPSLLEQLDGVYTSPSGYRFRRLPAAVYNLEDKAHLQKFLKGGTRTIVVPGGGGKIKYDAMQRIGVGISRLGTSEAVAIGAYVFALRKLDSL